MEKQTERQMENPQIRHYLYSKAAVRHVPISGDFELTPCCNMNCKMCYIRLSKEEQERAGRLRTAEEWIALGKTCMEAGMLFLLLTGGEPFLRPDFREIYEGLYKLGLVISINSNGTLITRETVEWLKEMPPTKINITLYGGSREAYEELCGYGDGYERAVAAILMLQEAGISVNVNVSFTRENAKEREKIFAFIDEHDLPSRLTSYMFPPVRKQEGGGKKTGERLSPEEAGFLSWKCVQFRNRKKDWEEERRRILNGLPEEIGDCPVDEQMRCMAGRSMFWITWNWELRCCGTMTRPSISVEPGNFMEKWEKLGKEMEYLLLPKECSVCELRRACTVCGATAQAEGSEVAHAETEAGASAATEAKRAMEKKPEYLCRMTKEYVRLLRQES